MRLIEVQFPGSFKPTPEELALLKAAWVYGQEINLADDGTLGYSWADYLMDAELMPIVPHTVKRIVMIRSEAPLGLDTNTAARGVVVNQKVNVAVPGLGLLLISEVHLLADGCTDALSDWLKEGWRILAICPQPDQRRPDYVLGRAGKEE